MTEEGFEDRRRAGEKRIAKRNAAQPDRPLEGPGSEERLQRLHGRFRALGVGGSKEPKAASLVIIGLAVFLTILLFGLGKPIIEHFADQLASGQIR